jgi:Na+/proline symporter
MILAGVAATVLLVVVIGLYASRKVRGDSENFIVAGRGLILPLAAATLMAQAVDTNATLGNTDLTSEFGFWAGASLPIGLALCLFITGLFFAKPLNRMRLTTLPDFYRRRYGRVVEVVSALIMVLSFSILLAGNLVAGGYLFQTFLGTSYAAGVLLIIGIVLIYTIAGGLFSVAYTDVIQVVIAFVGAVALIGYVSGVYGITIPEGMGPFAFEQLSDPEFGAYINWATLAALGLGDIVAIDFMQRVFASRNPQTARRACLLGSLGTLAVGLPFALIALSASDILETAGVQADGPVLYALLQDVVPAPLAVLVLSGIVAAGLSTADGAVLGTSAVSARNVLGLRDEGGPAHYEAEGQRDRLSSSTGVYVDDSPLATDGFELPGIYPVGGEHFGGYSYLATVFVVAPDAAGLAEELHSLLRLETGTLASSSAPSERLCISRMLTGSAPALYRMLNLCRGVVRERLSLPEGRRGIW